ncbi:MAG: IMP dehydrogenase, partial [Acidobacteria bacterium]|nr:IMP dehydrogenase [Acidobacteriota bacterium]
MNNGEIKEGLTFDDVLLVPAYSEVLPGEVDTRTKFSRGIELNIPICSSAMDTVTEASLAIALAQQGGIGVIHKNFSIEQQKEEVDKVKRSESGMIVDPVTIHASALVSEALRIMDRFKISGVPQIMAIAECVLAAEGSGVPVIADGGIKFSGDVAKAVVAG